MSLGPSKRSILIKRFLPNFLVCGCLAVLTLSVYAPVTFSEFFDYDDGMYLGRNLHVQAGFTKESILWAFTNTETGLWHPLTWLSHMLDITLFGLKPFGHHLTNLFFHSMNAGMIFLVMKLFTRAWIPSFMIAILFSIHPLHVESVAWVSERKNVLSMFFFLLSLWAYFRLVKGGQKRWYAVLVLFFVLGLMSKPSLVTLPFVLLLLDFWPLRRIKIPILGENWSVLVKLIAEKWLLFFITLISCVEAVFAQQSQSAIVSLQSWPAEVRLSNALVSYMAYFGKALLPFNLMFIYPHPGGEIKFWIIFFSAGLLGGITWLVSVTYDKRPYMLIGWLWFLGTLFPMIGIVQIGQQAMADRYAYIPLIGLFIMAAFWFWSEVSAMDEKKQVFFFLASMSVVLLS